MRQKITHYPRYTKERKSFTIIRTMCGKFKGLANGVAFNGHPVTCKTCQKMQAKLGNGAA